LSFLQAILLGVVQGLTEFLPVSSSGHLVILQHIFKLGPQSDPMILFDLAVHLGTMVAILIYYRRSLRKFFPHLVRSLKQINDPLGLYRRSASIRFTILAVVATGATGVVFVLFKDLIDAGFDKPNIVAFCWIFTAALLLITDRRKHTRRSLRQFGIIAALLVGLAQGLALFPGVSRSGSTICVAVLLGLHRRWAGEFSFLIGSVAITGASLVKGLEFFRAPHEPLSWGPIIIGMVVSALVGWLALALLIWALRRARLKYFAIYCAVLAGATLWAGFVGWL
jgi:undecaprenyl-diphosphatase